MSKYIKPPETCVWHSGPPPSIGWWPASAFCQPKILRWWNGKYWSEFAIDAFDKKQAGNCASLRDFRHGIEWAERWWEKK